MAHTCLGRVTLCLDKGTRHLIESKRIENCKKRHGHVDHTPYQRLAVPLANWIGPHVVGEKPAMSGLPLYLTSTLYTQKINISLPTLIRFFFDNVKSCLISADCFEIQCA